MNKFSRDLLQGMQEAAAFAREGARPVLGRTSLKCRMCGPFASSFTCRSSGLPRPTEFHCQL